MNNINIRHRKYPRLTARYLVQHDAATGEHNTSQITTNDLVSHNATVSENSCARLTSENLIQHDTIKADLRGASLTAGNLSQHDIGDQGPVLSATDLVILRVAAHEQ